jgi:hypothetical protein
MGTTTIVVAELRFHFVATNRVKILMIRACVGGAIGDADCDGIQRDENSISVARAMGR